MSKTDHNTDPDVGNTSEKESAAEISYAYVCSQCDYHEWLTESPVSGGNLCPECGYEMTPAASRRTSFG